jgi:hypothetical protein
MGGFFIYVIRIDSIVTDHLLLACGAHFQYTNRCVAHRLHRLSQISVLIRVICER